MNHERRQRGQRRNAVHLKQQAARPLVTEKQVSTQQDRKNQEPARDKSGNREPFVRDLKVEMNRERDHRAECEKAVLLNQKFHDGHVSLFHAGGLGQLTDPPLVDPFDREIQ